VPASLAEALLAEGATSCLLEPLLAGARRLLRAAVRGEVRLGVQALGQPFLRQSVRCSRGSLWSRGTGWPRTLPCRTST